MVRKGERGQVLILTLILLLVGGLILTPLLGFMGTGLLAGQVYEIKTLELYSADAGVEYAIWGIENGNLTFDEYNYAYPGTFNINSRDVNVTIYREDVDPTCNEHLVYQILSTADSTNIEAYLDSVPGGELDIFSGVLASLEGIDLGKNSSADGKIYHCGELKYSDLGGNWTDEECGGFPTEEQNIDFASTLKSIAEEGGTHTGDLDINTPTVLNSLYITGDLWISSNTELSIEGIVYVEGSVKLRKGVDDYTLSGSGSLISEGDIDLRKVSGFGASGDSILMSLNGDITFKKGGDLEALVYAPNGSISFDKSAIVSGGIVGSSITVKQDSSLTYSQKASSFDLPGGYSGYFVLRSYNING